MNKIFHFHGHRVILAATSDNTLVVMCATCLIPEVVMNAIYFMDKNNVKTLVVDGAEITYSHSEAF